MEREATDPREPIPGPGVSKLAPEGNSNARFVVPGDQDDNTESRDPEEPEDRTGPSDDD